MDRSDTTAGLAVGPLALLREAVRAVPAMRYALGVGGIAAIVAIVLTYWKLEARTAVFGGLVVFVAMVALVIFAALSRTGSAALRPLAMSMAWSFLVLTVVAASLFVSGAFFNWPQPLPCLLRGDGCLGKSNLDPNPEVDKELEKIVIPPGKEVAAAEDILNDLYARRFQRVYDRFSPAVQQTLTFTTFRDIAQRQLMQMGKGPLHRKLRFKPVAQAAGLMVQFDAEFDELSTWIELIGFVKIGQGWALYSINFQPASWATVNPATSHVLTDASPTEAIHGTQKGELAGAWTPPRGWRSTIKSSSKKAESTCDMLLTSGEIEVVAHDVLGGCAPQAGSALNLLGKIRSANGKRLDLEQVQYQLAMP